MTTITYGDGRSAEAHGFRLANVSMPSKAGTRGAVSFAILDEAGQPVTTMVRQDAKLLHLYVVRTDYGVFRHVYPRLTRGFWSAPVLLPAPGAYRVIAAFAVDSGNHVDHVILAGVVELPGTPRLPPLLQSSDRSVKLEVEGADSAIESGVLRVRVSGGHRRAARVLPYLGTSAHVVAFHQLTGIMVRPHPFGRAEHRDGATFLNLAAGLRLTGPYVFFVQVRTPTGLHTLKVDSQVG